MQHQDERWIDVIGADLRTGARGALTLARRGRRFASLWLGRVGAWFAFVHHRRVDARFAVFPAAMTMAEIAAVFASLILAMVLFADPLFLMFLDDRNATTIAVFERVTVLGLSDSILYPTGALLLAISLLPARSLARPTRLRLHEIALTAYFLFTTIAFPGLIANFLKNLIGRARPHFAPDGVVWASWPFHDNYQFASFPSGHATTAGAAAMALALLAPRYRVFVLLVGFWVALSRPVLGVHFPSDITAGFCLGAGFTWIYARSFARKRLLFRFRRDGAIVPRPAWLGRVAQRPLRLIGMT